MTTINLYQAPQEDKEKRKLRNANNGFIFSIGILIVTLLVLGGLKASASFLVQKNQKIVDSIRIQNEGLIGKEELENIFDFQSRLDFIKQSLNSKIDVGTELDHVASTLESNVLLSSFTIENKKISLKLNANNFTDVSKQIVAFKKSDYFSNPVLTAISRTESGISFEISMNLK